MVEDSQQSLFFRKIVEITGGHSPSWPVKLGEEIGE